MANGQLAFEFHEPPSAADLDSLRVLLAGELPDWSQSLIDLPPRHRPSEVGETVGMAALVLCVPSSLLASWDLAQRLKLKEKIERVIAQAQARRARGQANPFLLPTKGAAIPLDSAKADQVLDTIAAQTRRTRPHRR